MIDLVQQERVHVKRIKLENLVDALEAYITEKIDHAIFSHLNEFSHKADDSCFIPKRSPLVAILKKEMKETLNDIF